MGIRKLDRYMLKNGHVWVTDVGIQNENHSCVHGLFCGEVYGDHGSQIETFTSLSTFKICI